MGGKSGKPTIGYWYDMDVLATACLKLDEVVEFKFADRSAWSGSMTESGTIAIYKDDLFGGEEREGGVFGQVDVMMGEPTQPVNEFLGSSMRASGITGPVPAYRNSVNFFFRGVTSADPEFPASGVFIGEAAEPPPSTVPSFTSKPKSQPKAFRWSAMNPYFKPFKVKVRRFTKDWHPEIAKISVSSATTVIPANTTWDYCQFPHSVAVGSVNPESKTPPPVGGGGYTWFNGPAIIGWNSSGSYPSMLPAHGDVASWIIKTINVPTDANTITFSGAAENSGYLYIDGEYVYSNNPTNYQPSTNEPFVYSTKIAPGTHTIAVLLTNERNSGSSSTDDISFSTSIEMSNSSTDMNPAHIIRECITDTDWGLGWPTSEIDDVSFFASATTLHSEKFGLSFKWSQQMTIEDFIMMVLRHINGVLYQDRVTGKFKLKLIRNDYVIGDLVELNPNNANLESLSRAISGEMVNIINLTYSKPDGGVDTITVHDISSMDVQGPISQDVEMLGIRSPTLAARVAQRELESRIKPIAKISITTNRVGSNFHEGGLFKLNWPDQGISAMACRIVTIDTGNLTDNQIRIDAVQDVFGLPTTSYITPQTTTWVDPTSQPQAAPTRVITETPYYEIARRLTESELAYLDGTDCYIDVFASEPSSDAIDFNLWSASGSSELINRSTGTHAAMTTLAAPAVMEELSVLNLTNARDIAYAIESENAYILIGSEYAKVVDYDVSANTITVNRGVLDTTIMAHAAGTIVILADSSAASDEISYLPDEVVSVKVQTRTARGVLPIDSAPVNTYTINQRQARPYPPGQVRVNGIAYPETIGLGSGLNLTWKHRNRLTQTASIIDQATGTITPEVGTEYELRIYGDTDTLLRTETLTGESFNYTTVLEAADGGGSLVDTTLRVDPWWDKTKLLINFNGVNASTTFTDSSPNFATVFGDARISTAQSKFGGASGYFNGTSDRLVSDLLSSLNDGDFTIEMWVRRRGDAAAGAGFYQHLFDMRSAEPSVQITLDIAGSTGGYQFGYYVNGVYRISGGVATLNTWLHVALVRSSGVTKLYVNGAQVGSDYTDTNNFTGKTFTVGGRFAAVSSDFRSFNGHIDDLRVTKGVARYTSSFTPPVNELGRYVKPTDYNDSSALVTFEYDSLNLYANFFGNELVMNLGNFPYWGAPTGTEAAWDQGDYVRATTVSTDSKFGTRCAQGRVFMKEQPNFGIRTGQYQTTIDFWVKIPSDFTFTGTYFHPLIMMHNRWELNLQYPNTNLVFATMGSNHSGVISSFNIPVGLPVGSWNHIEISMLADGSHTTCAVNVFINGVLAGSGTVPFDEVAGVSEPRLGTPYAFSDPGFLFDEFRMRKVIAHTSGFTPPTSSIMPIDPNWSNTVLLVNFNGDNGSTEIENVAELTKTLTAVGNAQISTAQSKFGGASGYFDGAGDYIEYQYNSALNIGSGDFTIEFWMRPGSVSVGQVIFDWRSANSDFGLAIYQSSSAPTQVTFSAGDSNTAAWEVTLVSTTTLVIDTWCHVAAVRNGNLWSLFINGVNEATTTNTVTPYINSANVRIGASRDSTSGYNGYLDDLRVTKGTRYRNEFVPPVTELSKMTSGIDPQWDNVCLLLNNNGADLSTSITDSSSFNRAVTVVGNAKLSTGQSRFGTASLLLDGTGDYVTVPNSIDFSASRGDFTVESWIRPANVSSLRTIATKRPSTGTVTEWSLVTSAAGKLGATAWNSSGTVIVNFASVTSLVIDTWAHVALTRRDTTWYLFINGVMEASAVETGIAGANSSVLCIGTDPSTAGRDFHGYIDDFRFTKNYARYTEDFIVPNVELGMTTYTSTSLNSKLRFELESKRDGLTSWMMHNHTVTRA